MGKTEKTLTERIVENARELPKRGRSNRNMALFLAHQEEIQQALDDGWNIKAVWHTLNKEGTFPATYCCFLFYVKKFIFKANSQKKEFGADHSEFAAQSPKTPSFTSLSEKKDTGISRFQHNATPQVETLI